MGTVKICQKRVLLVDDEQDVRESVRELLSSDDYAVVEANNGAEALLRFQQDRFDLVLTDFKLPFLAGDELASRIKQLLPSQPILMITGFEKEAGPRNPVDAILKKPFGLPQLRTAMLKVFEGTRLASPEFETEIILPRHAS